MFIDHYLKTSLVQVDYLVLMFFVALVEFLLEKGLFADLSILIDYLIHRSWVQVNL